MLCFHLKSLSLSINSIQTIEKDAFEDCHDLELLDLNRCGMPLNFLPDGIFQGPRSLTELYIAGNV